MLKLHELKPYKNSTKRRKVVGRGVGSGHGTFSGRGAKGQKARSGSSIPVGFEGGRMPIQRQMPKLRGFKSRTPKAVGVSLERINDKFTAGQTVNPKELFHRKLIKSHHDTIKILGDGKISKALTFENVLVTASAQDKISQAGGKITTTANTHPAKEDGKK